jgi:hypothetical protein
MSKNIATSIALMKFAKTLFSPIIEIRDLMKEASGEKTCFLSMEERKEILKDAKIDRIETIGFNSVSIKSKLKYGTFVPIYLQLFCFGNQNSREFYVEICESNIGENAFQILEKRNPNYKREAIEKIVELYNCKEMGHSVGLRLQAPYSIGDLICAINNVAQCCFDISNYKG